LLQQLLTQLSRNIQLDFLDIPNSPNNASIAKLSERKHRRFVDHDLQSRSSTATPNPEYASVSDRNLIVRAAAQIAIKDHFARSSDRSQSCSNTTPVDKDSHREPATLAIPFFVDFECIQAHHLVIFS
jgi:hypothetical protein